MYCRVFGLNDGLFWLLTAKRCLERCALRACVHGTGGIDANGGAGSGLTMPGWRWLIIGAVMAVGWWAQGVLLLNVCMFMQLCVLP